MKRHQRPEPLHHSRNPQAFQYMLTSSLPIASERKQKKQKKKPTHNNKKLGEECLFNIIVLFLTE